MNIQNIRLSTLIEHIKRVDDPAAPWHGILTTRQQIDAINTYYHYYLASIDRE